MSNYNKCVFSGNVGSAPEIRTMQSGERVASFSLACGDKWKDKATGEAREKTQWVPIVVFNQGLITVVERYVKKGSRLLVEGCFETRSWEKDGQKRYATEIVLRPYNGFIELLDPRGAAPSEQAADAIDDLEDEIPF